VEEGTMSELIVLAFPEAHGAERALAEIGRLQREQLIVLEDAATVTREGDGKPKVKQATSLVGAGAWGGAFWGMLIGLLFFMPWLGLAVGAVTGALAAKFSDFGIDDQFIREVQAKIQPGQSALFLLVRQATTDKVIDALRPYGPEVLRTSLSKEQEQKLRDAMGAYEAWPGEPAPPATEQGQPAGERVEPAAQRSQPSGEPVEATAEQTRPVQPAGA
jgi:uncharacterized membrane protein